MSSGWFNSSELQYNSGKEFCGSLSHVFDMVLVFRASSNYSTTVVRVLHVFDVE